MADFTDEKDSSDLLSENDDDENDIVTTVRGGRPPPPDGVAVSSIIESIPIPRDPNSPPD